MQSQTASADGKRRTKSCEGYAALLRTLCLDDGYLTRSEYAKDREALRKWLIRSLLKSSGIWGSGLDTLLTALREEIQKSGGNGFPSSEIEKLMAARGKALTFSTEEIEELCELGYGDKATFALLSLLFPGFDFSQHFHVDHIFPKSRFTKATLKKANFADQAMEDVIAKSNRLPNLQLLVGTINNEKRAKMPHEWYAAQWPDELARQQYLQNQAINSVPDSLVEFEAFYALRRATLKKRIEVALA